MQLTMPLLMFMSVLFPAKLWVTPNQPLNIDVRGAGKVTLKMTDFAGKTVGPAGGPGSNVLSGDQTVDLRKMFMGPMNTPGTYVLWAVPTGKSLPAFVGTPLVLEVREDRRRDAPPGPMVVHIEPLRYAQISTDQGDMTVAFYFDAAPNTCASFLSLAQGGFYDGLTFHRVVPNFIIQGGDPRGDGTGGPGFDLPAEFNDREHREGVLSMAREADPIEREGGMPGYPFANSAGSQFFICLNYEKTKQLDHRYTAFGKVVDGMETVNALGNVPVGGETGDAPKQPPVIKSIKVLAVSSSKNPYAAMMNFPALTTQPTTQPATVPATIPAGEPTSLSPE